MGGKGKGGKFGGKMNGKAEGKGDHLPQPNINAMGMMQLRWLNTEEVEWVNNKIQTTEMLMEHDFKAILLEANAKCMMRMFQEKRSHLIDLSRLPKSELDEKLSWYPTSSAAIERLKPDEYCEQQTLMAARLLSRDGSTETELEKIQRQLKRQNESIEKMNKERDEYRRKCMEEAREEGRRIEAAAKAKANDKFRPADGAHRPSGPTERDRRSRTRSRSSKKMTPMPTIDEAPGDAAGELMLSCSSTTCSGRWSGDANMKPACCTECGSAWSGL